jgi:hypothetical protein
MWVSIPPHSINPKEYESLVLKESMRDYFKKKTDAIDGKKKEVKR